MRCELTRRKRAANSCNSLEELPLRSGSDLWVTEYYLRSGIVALNLRTQFLNLGGLFFDLSNQIRNFSLQLFNHDALIPHGSVLLQKLIQQHRVDCFVSNRVHCSVGISEYQIGIHLCDFFSNQAELRYAFGVAFVVEGDG